MLPSKECKFCGSLAHYPYTCFMNPKVKSYRIRRKGRATLEYEAWRDAVAKPYLDETFGRWCTDCLRSDLPLDVDHILTRGSRADLKMSLNNIAYRCRECHMRKTNHGGV